MYAIVLKSLVIFLLKFINLTVNCDNYDFINLPVNHLPQYFSTYKNVADKCLNDADCPYANIIRTDKSETCWGYEPNCQKEHYYSKLKCPGDYTGYVQSKEAQIDTFYSQADFGFIRDQIKELTVLCEPLFSTDSFLECSKYLRFCRGRNIMVNFTDLAFRDEPLRYKMDVLKQGQIAGYCKLREAELKEEVQHVSPLQSWAPELRYFETLNQRPIENNLCDIVIDKPTFFMKIDATINMYHHFCDFINLYASLHVNSTHPLAFDTDINILIWESYTYESPFAETFRAFTDNSLWDLKTFRGKTVCFKNLVLPLLPRMIFGLYYNTPIIYGCENSGLFHAFSEHILHRLKIRQKNRKGDRRIRITFLSRQTRYRKILNEQELVTSLSANEKYLVNHVNFGSRISFKEQLKITRNTDIFIGMHGAGLSHLLFLPKWAVLFELYHCEDPNCYQDLARLRGVKYMTWTDKSKVFPENVGGENEEIHAKFTNYAFDVNEFERIVAKATYYVDNHEEYRKFLSKPYKKLKEEL